MTDVIETTTPVGDIAVHYPSLRITLEQLGIDYCCGGKQSLLVASEAAGHECQAVLDELNRAVTTHSDHNETDWGVTGLGVLVDHIVDTHHAFMKEQLPRLEALLIKVQHAHGAQHGDLLEKLRKQYSSIRSELEPHLMKEEEILFPSIKGIDAFMQGIGEPPVIHCGSVAHPITQMEHEHDDAGLELAAIRTLTNNYSLPPDACPTFAALYEGLEAMEADLHEHIHLENNILFPRIVEMEKAMIQGTA